MKPWPLTTSSRMEDRNSVTSEGSGKVSYRFRCQIQSHVSNTTSAYPVDFGQRLAARLKLLKRPFKLGDQFRCPFPLPQVRPRAEFVRCPNGRPADFLGKVLVRLDQVPDGFELTGGELFWKCDGHFVESSVLSGVLKMQTEGCRRALFNARAI
jgi:hypothetical protein